MIATTRFKWTNKSLLIKLWFTYIYYTSNDLSCSRVMTTDYTLLTHFSDNYNSLKKVHQSMITSMPMRGNAVSPEFFAKFKICHNSFKLNVFNSWQSVCISVQSWLWVHILNVNISTSKLNINNPKPGYNMHLSI